MNNSLGSFFFLFVQISPFYLSFSLEIYFCKSQALCILYAVSKRRDIFRLVTRIAHRQVIRRNVLAPFSPSLQIRLVNTVFTSRFSLPRD